MNPVRVVEGLDDQAGGAVHLTIELAVDFGKLQKAGSSVSADVEDTAGRKKFRVENVVLVHLRVDLVDDQCVLGMNQRRFGSHTW